MIPHSLTLYESPFKKIRLGKDFDGGYIICDLPNIKYDFFISCGIDNDISFEEQFCKKYNEIKCYAFDGTINSININNNNIQFIKKNIDINNTINTTNLHDIINIHNSIFLKMDIEGAEYKWINTLSDDQLNKFSQIVIEFHFIFDPFTFNKLNKLFYLVHYHANNFCGYRIIDNISIPNVFECTYINKKFLLHQPELNKKTLPTELDMPNIKELPEYYIDYPPFVN